MSLTMRAASGAMNGFRRVTSMRAKPSSYQRFMCSSAASSNVSAESIIDQCLKVRESIQVLNDVSMLVSVSLSDITWNVVFSSP